MRLRRLVLPFGMMALVSYLPVLGGAQTTADSSTSSTPEISDLTCLEHVALRSNFRFCIEADNALKMSAAFDLHQAFDRLDAISEWLDEKNEKSDIYAVNSSANQHPIKVRKEVMDLLVQLREIYDKSGGLLDPTLQTVRELYRFSKTDPEVPREAELKLALPRVNFKLVQLDEKERTVYFTKPGIKISLGNIAIGFCLDEALRMLKKHYKAGTLEARAVALFWGPRSTHEPWQLRVHDPHNNDVVLATLSGDQFAVATVGDTQSSFDLAGVHYHSMLDPKTGKPSNQSRQCTVIATQASWADVLDGVCFLGGLNSFYETWKTQIIGALAVGSKGDFAYKGVQPAAKTAGEPLLFKIENH